MTDDQKKEKQRGEEKEEKEFKVEDRRTSTGGEGKGKKAAEAETEAIPGKGADPKASRPGEPADALKGDFSTFVFSLFSSALIQLGDMADPITGNMDPNITAAKQTIDIVDILKEKTKGNLSDEESKLLENASAELKWKYLDAVKKKD